MTRTAQALSTFFFLLSTFYFPRVDEDRSGTVEISEFAPLMFDYLVRRELPLYSIKYNVQRIQYKVYSVASLLPPNTASAAHF